MKRIALALFLSVSPAVAQDSVPETEDGFSLIEEGAKLILRGLMTQMEPALDDMEDALTSMEPALKALGPKLQQLIALIDDIKNYEAPKMLPNGDIIIRRTAPLPPRPDFLPGPSGEIEL